MNHSFDKQCNPINQNEEIPKKRNVARKLSANQNQKDREISTGGDAEDLDETYAVDNRSFPLTGT